MRHWRRQLFRFCLIATLGSGLASFAAPERPKGLTRVAHGQVAHGPVTDGPVAPIIQTTAVSRANFDQCLRPPRSDPEERPIGDLQANRARKKIVLCG